ncbi:MAG TPA: hypothetical protein VNH17_07995 [Streptosporangiaceae bacterium]|nr:hypothetical protein [Streptosporangiaceae bacterium]
MADELLNGRAATDFEVAAITRGRECELERDRRVVAGLLAEYPREPGPVPRHVTDIEVDFATTRRRP